VGGVLLADEKEGMTKEGGRKTKKCCHDKEDKRKEGEGKRQSTKGGRQKTSGFHTLFKGASVGGSRGSGSSLSD